MPKELAILKDVIGIQLENLKNEFSSFFNRVKKLNQQIENVENWQLTNLKEFIQVNINYYVIFKKNKSLFFFF